DGRDVVAVAQHLAERIHERSLAGPDGAADTDAQRSIFRDHERNSLVYWVSCFMDAMSARSAAPPSSSSVAPSAAAATSAITGLNAAMMRWPSVWPMGMARTPADTMLAAKAVRVAESAAAIGISCVAAATATAIG